MIGFILKLYRDNGNFYLGYRVSCAGFNRSPGDSKFELNRKTPELLLLFHTQTPHLRDLNVSPALLRLNPKPKP